MRIAGLQKLTLLDFPGKAAATVFTPGCNFRCPFCHNAELVVGGGTTCDRSMATSGEKDGSAAESDRGAARRGDASGNSERTNTPNVSEDEFFAFLDKRRGLLDGVCITGGEPLMQLGIAEFCAAVKERGFAVKLDTNGSFPERLRTLVEAGVIDYVAMDAKNCASRYGETIGAPAFDVSAVEASIAYLLSGAVPFEFRTTVVREFHDEESLVELARWIAGTPAWYLQGFVDSDTVLAGEGTMHGYSADELRGFLPALKEIVPNVDVRGV